MDWHLQSFSNGFKVVKNVTKKNEKKTDKILQNLTGPGNFEFCFCVIVDHSC